MTVGRGGKGGGASGCKRTRRINPPPNGPGARFSKAPVTLRVRNQIFKSKYKEYKTRVQTSKQLHVVSLTDSFIPLDAKLLKPRSLM